MLGELFGDGCSAPHLLSYTLCRSQPYPSSGKRPQRESRHVLLRALEVPNELLAWCPRRPPGWEICGRYVHTSHWHNLSCQLTVCRNIVRCSDRRSSTGPVRFRGVVCVLAVRDSRARVCCFDLQARAQGVCGEQATESGWCAKGSVGVVVAVLTRRVLMCRVHCPYIAQWCLPDRHSDWVNQHQSGHKVHHHRATIPA